MEKFDAIVIGAGLGGLSSAGYLAKAGKKVLVLERNPVPGGYATEFRRGKYRFEAALHAIDGAGPGGWSYSILKELGVMERVAFHRLDPFYTAIYPENTLVAHADPVAYEAELVRLFPHEKEGIRALFDEMIAVYWEVRRFIVDGEMGLRPELESIPSHYSKMLAAQTSSLSDFFTRFISDPKLRAMLSTLWPYYGLPPAELNAATFIFPFVSFHLFGAYYPTGGSQALSRALEKTIVENGGLIKYRQTVRKIEVKDGRAVAVETEAGLRVEADVIVSNSNAPDTLLKMVDQDQLPSDYLKKVKTEANSISTFCVFLGLDRDIRHDGFNYHELFVADGYDPEKDHQNSIAGNFDKTGMCITNYTVVDPGCAPEGGSVLMLLSMADWNTNDQWGTNGNLENYGSNPQYLELKEAAADELIDRAEKLIPNLRKSVKYKEISTPMTNWKYSQNPGGGLYGSAQSVENAYFNRLSAKTPIPNLFLAGAWAFGGGMSAALLSGRETSRIALGVLAGNSLEPLMGVELPAGTRAAQVAQTEVVEKGSQVGVVCTVKKTDGAGLPAVTIKAIGSGREVALRAIGKPAVLMFHAKPTAEQVGKINKDVRTQARDRGLADFLVASVVDLHSVPKLFRGFAEGAMLDSYNAAAASLPAGEVARDMVVILPDWDGGLAKAAGLKEVDKVVGVVVLDGEGSLLGRFQTANPTEQILTALAKK